MSKVPGEPTPRDFRRELNDLRREVQRLRHTRTDELVPYHEREVIFSHPGIPVANESSPPYLFRDLNGVLSRVDITVVTTGSTKTVLEIKAVDSDGANPQTVLVTLPAGERYVVDEGWDFDIEEYSAVTVKATQVGTGVKDMTVAAIFMVSDEG